METQCGSVNENQRNQQEVARYRGEVDELDPPEKPGYIRIVFSLGDGKQLAQRFPRKIVEGIDAAFPGAQVEYVTILRYVGPTREELIAEGFDSLSEDELAALEDDGASVSSGKPDPVHNPDLTAEG